jgi:hypothetical protein
MVAIRRLAVSACMAKLLPDDPSDTLHHWVHATEEMNHFRLGGLPLYDARLWRG